MGLVTTGGGMQYSVCRHGHAPHCILCRLETIADATTLSAAEIAEQREKHKDWRRPAPDPAPTPTPAMKRRKR